ncbi:MAG: hypothetical protein HXX11_11895 [Desulfuromonadales bacterium]|nr:hypothetical protein [Desulfuromonadales bacterium]
MSVNSSIYPIIGTFVGVALGAWLARNTAFKIVDRQEKNRDFLALKNSFIPAMRILRKDQFTTEEFKRFPTLFENQDIAMLSFVGHLGGENRRCFDEYWNKYKEWQKEFENLETGMENAGIVLLTSTRRPELVKLIEDILEAAKKY